jgi:hypothetical protein
VAPRKHYVLPDLQIAPGDPLDHLDWIAKDIVRRKPDVIVCIGDLWQNDALSSYDGPGHVNKEGARIENDLDAGRRGLARLMLPIHNEIERLIEGRRKRWTPRLVFCEGNHEHRVQRAIDADPRWIGTLSMRAMDVEIHGFERYPFLKPVEIDGVHYAHYFQSEKSPYPIGGTMDNRLNKICASFVCGHEQGLLTHRRPLPIGRTIHGIVAGSCYLKTEHYRGAQRNNEFRGVVVLQDVRNGNFEPMALTLRYMCDEYANRDLVEYMDEKYPGEDWGYLAA